MSEKEVQKTGYTKNTPNSFLMNAGAVYMNMRWDQGQSKWKGELLGATADGNKLTIEQSYRTISVDGVFTDAVGQKVLEHQKAKLEVNVKELTWGNLKLAINGSMTQGDGTTAPSDYKVITAKGKLEKTDYIKNLGLVATVSGSDKPVIVILDNALCTSGLEAEFKDNDEVVVTMTFEAHASADQVANLALPCRIYYPEVQMEV